ncbi:unnamed protein product [Nezara viridula]|uniref:Reverse transcriptase domain-containing protein n=1 Tax=Nezara viridula TaxID=85310 RepID=A0A9P0HJV4_NEZVI|nr:unnamed protein product [Nezara viridula]
MANSNRQMKAKCVVEEIHCDRFGKCELEFKRIQKLVDETVNRITFAMTVPKLLDNDLDLIKSCLTEDQLKLLKQIFAQYFPSESLWLSKKTTRYSNLYCMQSLDKIEEYFNTYSTRTENIPLRDEYEFSYALQLLYTNENIRKISINNKTSISEAGFNFVQDMKLFLYSLIDKLKMSPQQSETKEAYLRKLCQHHHELTDEAHILEEEAIEQVKSMEENLKTKLNDVLEVKHRSDSLMEDCRAYIQKSGLSHSSAWSGKAAIRTNPNGTIYDRLTQHLAYADDVVISARTRAALEEFENTAANLGMIINDGKPVYMQTSKNKYNTNEQLNLGRRTFRAVPIHERHLQGSPIGYAYVRIASVELPPESDPEEEDVSHPETRPDEDNKGL